MIDNPLKEENNQFSASGLHLKCVILAAGASLRLRPLTDIKPKCLLEVGGKAILGRIIENVLDAGVQGDSRRYRLQGRNDPGILKTTISAYSCSFYPESELF